MKKKYILMDDIKSVQQKDRLRDEILNLMNVGNLEVREFDFPEPKIENSEVPPPVQESTVLTKTDLLKEGLKNYKEEEDDRKENIKKA